MHFDAIVHAPELRPGARLNIAEADQVEAQQPTALGIGAEIRLRIGVCAPALSLGRIVGYTAHPERAVLAIGAGTWTLCRSQDGGVAVPGLMSEAWYVVAVGEVASPSDHSLAHSAREPATSG